MGTRSTIHILDDGLVLGAFYRQYDGYPAGMGTDIKNILTDHGTVDPMIVNGYQFGDEVPETFNGMGCLGAYLISKLKDSIGNVYLHHPDWNKEEYHYDIYDGAGRPFMRILDCDENVLYNGPVTEFDDSKIIE